MNKTQVLEHFKVTDDVLDRALVHRLDEDGFFVLPKFFDPQQVQAFRERFVELAKEDPERCGEHEPGSVIVPDLVNSGEMFDVLYTHPLLLAAVSHVLPGDITLGILSGRDPRPGHGHQVLHADWREEVPEPGNWQGLNSIFLLDDFTDDNGATRVVPGSHRWGKAPADVMRDPAESHPQEQLIVAPAGSLLVFNVHLWHGGTVNRSGRPRRSLFAFYTTPANAEKRKVTQAEMLLPRTRARLGPEALYLLGA
ncbi:phytanoyl-CoA dioxygenase family protein [Streptomyces sp. NPDC014733]|uniref:phytanoyl-CoA dioxygenase family protein n=1 Tax=Streptomyces sp. NPDC014733 TaxID=3364885 RepID=UPI0037020C08